MTFDRVLVAAAAAAVQAAAVRAAAADDERENTSDAAVAEISAAVALDTESPRADKLRPWAKEQ